MNINRLWEYAALVIIMLCAFWVRWSGAASYSYHTDELIHLFIADGQDIGEVFARGLKETHPPLGHFIRYILFFIRDGLLPARMALIVSGLFTIGVCYAVGRAIDRRGYSGLVLAFVAAFSFLTVVYTVSVRNYGFFILFNAISYYYFIAYGQSGKRKDLLCYGAYCFLACFTHFSGFIGTFILSSSLAVMRIKDRDFRAFASLAILHIPHFLLLAVLYYLYFIGSHVGEGWYGVYLTLTPFTVLRHFDLLNALYDVYYGIFFPQQPLWFLALLAMSICGMLVLWQKQRLAAVSIFIMLITSMVLAVLHIYPMTGLRYGSYLFIFYALPLAACMAELVNRSRLPHAAICSLLAAAALAYSAYAVAHDVYFSDNSEFTNTNESFNGGIAYLRQHTKAGDVIITNKGSWLHLLYLKDKHHSGYYPQPLGHMDFEGRMVYFYERPNFWEYTLKDYFYDFLPLVQNKLHNTHNIWFMVLGTSDYAIMTLGECKALRPYISNEYHGFGVWMFKLDADIMRSRFFPPSKEIDTCFTQSTVPQIGGVFGRK